MVKTELPSIAGVLAIPDDYKDLKFTTRITVYNEHQLADNQSSLILPKRFRAASPQIGNELNFSYIQGRYPHFKFEYQTTPGILEQPLPAHLDYSCLGVSHLKRLWHKAQQTRAGCLNDLIRQQECQLDLILLDHLQLSLEPAIAFLYQNRDLKAFEDYILANHLGGITDSIIVKITQTVENFIELSADTQNLN